MNLLLTDGVRLYAHTNYRESLHIKRGDASVLMNGAFSAAMREQFVRIIEYYGQDPYIIRSSSILEDGFGNAFAGKYESVFCANRGSLETRLAEFEHAIKVVYASTMSLSALDYRKRRELDNRDEQMALLIQRVSGSYYGSRYMPCAAGVGYSYSPYRVMKDTDPAAGMLRLVMGLGTSAVDRTEGSYPRIVNLDQAAAGTRAAAPSMSSSRKKWVPNPTPSASRRATKTWRRPSPALCTLSSRTAPMTRSVKSTPTSKITFA